MAPSDRLDASLPCLLGCVRLCASVRNGVESDHDPELIAASRDKHRERATMGLMTALREDFYPATLGALPTTPNFTIDSAIIAAWASQAAYEVDDEAKFCRIVDRW